ncbi:hypothetical protein ACGFYF_24595 [Streptomyces lavendulae]|uniref:hypothetical protein n=1 Tax=Streptomyces lavendulae TaxID=1914 RepID=UPI00249FD55B|nr:hypothetical protein [Streptomyces lavendulae]GLW00813.1 hypothetical protein Slala05_44440 [Streptomyces lavendulae subsp. lavendulae]
MARPRHGSAPPGRSHPEPGWTGPGPGRSPQPPRGGGASWQDHGKPAVEEGAHVYGVDTSIPGSEPGLHPYGIGRDGSTVTVVMWGRMGHLADAPVPAFRKTTTAAVNRLDP